MSKVLRYLVLLYPVVVLCSPFIFNVRFDFLYLIFIATASFFYKNKTKVSIPSYSLYVFLVVIFTLFSTFFFYATNSADKIELSLLLFWPRIFLLILICYWSAELYNIKCFIGSLKYFFYILFIILCLGFFDVFELLPEFYHQIKSLFLPTYSQYMVDQLNDHTYTRATSIFVHPSIYCYASIFLLLTRLLKHKIPTISSVIITIICVVFILLPFSKVGFIVLPLVFFYYFIIIKRKYLFSICTLIASILLVFFAYKLGKSGIYGGTIFHLTAYFIDAVINQGLFESIFKTRYSLETGLLVNNYNSILKNIFWGSGACIHSNIFIGDSFYIANMTMYGSIGTLLIAGYFLLLYCINRINIIRYSNFKICYLFKSLNAMIILNIIIGFGLDFSSVYKLSEVFCFYTFLNYYGFKAV